MVDFQSRDTRRSRTSDEEAEETDDTGASEETGETAAEAQNEAETEQAQRAGDETPRSVGVGVVTVSDTRSFEDDPAGIAIKEVLEAAGHEVVTRDVLRQTHDGVQQAVDALVKRDDVEVVVSAGAVGVAPDDVTVEAVHPLFDKALPGFGELFRRHYYEQVGTDVVATRAAAGVAGGTPIFCLPADPEAARLGVAEIVVEAAPELVERTEPDPSSLA